MTAIYENSDVRANCPDCHGALSTFEYETAHGPHGTIIKLGVHSFNGKLYNRILYVLMRCAGCGRAGLATVHDNTQAQESALGDFYPTSRDHLRIPDGVPSGVEHEFREAERCAAIEAWRGASGLVRSVLEKTLRANGYKGPNLSNRIDLAAQDGVITESRRKKAHEDVRVLGNGRL